MKGFQFKSSYTYRQNLFVDAYHVRLSLPIKQFTCSHTSIILSYGQIQILHIYCPSSPFGLRQSGSSSTEALNNQEGQTWGPVGCSRTHQPPPRGPWTNPQASLSAAELWKQLCSHNRVCAQTQLTFFVASKAIWYTIPWNIQAQSHAHACPYVYSEHVQTVLRWIVQDTTLLSCQNLNHVIKIHFLYPRIIYTFKVYNKLDNMVSFEHFPFTHISNYKKHTYT